MPSRTACRVYRNLAVLAYDLSEENVSPAEADELLHSLYRQTRESEENQYTLYDENGRLSRMLCTEVAGILLQKNLEQAEAVDPDRAKAWGVISMNSTGNISSAAGTTESNKQGHKRSQRIADILMGEVWVEKSDLMFLIWFTSNLIWDSQPRLSQPQEVKARLEDFMAYSNAWLAAALLQPFYPPHLLEQSMLIAICMAQLKPKSTDSWGKTRVKERPASLYGFFMEAVKRVRQKKTGAESHSIAFQYEAIDYLDANRDDFENRYGFSAKSMNEWSKTFRDREELLTSYNTHVTTLLREHARACGFEEAFEQWRPELLKVLDVIDYSHLHGMKLKKAVIEYGAGPRTETERREDLMELLRRAVPGSCCDQEPPRLTGEREQKIREQADLVRYYNDHPELSAAEYAGSLPGEEPGETADFLTALEIWAYLKKHPKPPTKRNVEECAALFGVGRAKTQALADLMPMVEIIRQCREAPTLSMGRVIDQAGIAHLTDEQEDFLAVVTILDRFRASEDTLENCARRSGFELTGERRTVIEIAKRWGSCPQRPIPRCAGELGYDVEALSGHQRDMLDMIRVTDACQAHPEQTTEDLAGDFGIGRKITRYQQNLLNMIETGIRLERDPMLGLERCAAMSGLAPSRIPKSQADTLKLLVLFADFGNQRDLNVSKRMKVYEIDEKNMLPWQKDLLAMLKIAAYRNSHAGRSAAEGQKNSCPKNPPPISRI